MLQLKVLMEILNPTFFFFHLQMKPSTLELNKKNQTKDKYSVWFRYFYHANSVFVFCLKVAFSSLNETPSLKYLCMLPIKDGYKEPSFSPMCMNTSAISGWDCWSWRRTLCSTSCAALTLEKGSTYTEKVFAVAMLDYILKGTTSAF